jgi:ATP-dependent DNA helicase MPH1
MPVSGDDSDHYFDDEIDDVIVPGTPDAVKSAQKNNRPAKRRRLDAGVFDDAGKLPRPDIRSGSGSDTSLP